MTLPAMPIAVAGGLLFLLGGGIIRDSGSTTVGHPVVLLGLAVLGVAGIVALANAVRR